MLLSASHFTWSDKVKLNSPETQNSNHTKYKAGSNKSHNSKRVISKKPESN